MYKKLTRSRDQKIAGICGGIAEYFDVDPTLIRVLYALASLLTGVIFGFITYLVLCAIIPQR